LMARRALSPADARALLARSGDDLRLALE
jgi:hypothetical protein